MLTRRRCGPCGPESAPGSGRRSAAGLLAALLIGGCAAKRSGYDVPEVPLPAQYRNQAAIPVAEPAATPAPPPPGSAPGPAPTAAPRPADPYADWWRVFGSRELVGLVDRVVANNPDIRIATLRIAQASARAEQARAGLAPTLSAPLGTSIQAPGGPIGDVPVGTNDRSVTQKLYQASLRANWRIDLWGEQSALAESANLQVWQAAFERDDIQRQVIANLASAYVEFLSLNDRLRIATEAERVLGNILATIERRVAAGDATVIDLDQQRAAIFAVRATIPNLEQQRDDALTAIAALAGTVPGSLQLTADGLESLDLPQVIPPLPSTLLLRRPDVRMAEARLLAADADIDVARARLLPPLDLSAQVGYSSLAMSRLFQPLSLFWNALANLTVSIFDRGRAASEKAQAQAAHEEMLETYARAIYQSLREVETALSTLRLSARRFDAQQEATASARKAWLGSAEVYSVGGLDYPALLDAERTYHRYADEFERIRMERYRGYISLFQALGGGVDFGERLPGEGRRPVLAAAGPATAAAPPAARRVEAEGMDWLGGGAGSSAAGWQIEEFWQVELPGMYHRATIGAAWRDLRNRFPAEMEGRIVRPRLLGRIEESSDGQIAWYRLYVGKFGSPAAAGALCTALRASFQRCRVVSSRSDDTVAFEAPPAQAEAMPPLARPGPEPTPAPLPVVPPVALPGAAPAADSATTPPTAPVAIPVAAPVAAEAAPTAVVIAVPESARTLPAVAGGWPAGERDSRAATAAAERTAYTVQLGVYSNLDNAVISHAVWQFREQPVFVAEIREGDGRPRYAVRTGVFARRQEAAALAEALRRKEDAPAVVVPTTVDGDGKPEALAASELELGAPRREAAVVPEPPEAPAASGPERDAGPFAVQLGAFATRENAEVSRKYWQSRKVAATIVDLRDGEGRTWYAVRTGSFAARRAAVRHAVALGRREDAPALVVRATAAEAAPPRVTATFLPASVAGRESPAAAAGKASKRPVYAVQLDAFASLDNAERALAAWRGKGYDAYLCEIRDGERRPLFAVRAGAFRQRSEASGLVRSLQRKEAFRARLVPAVLDDSGRLAVIQPAALRGAAQ